MKLWVDDIRDAPDDSWTEVRKVQPAISFLSKYCPEEISLDHDIENRPDDETFEPIAYFIGQKYAAIGNIPKVIVPEWNPKITIHSINPVGAKAMQDILLIYDLKSERKPYAPDLKRMKEQFGQGDLMDGEVS